MNCDLHIDTGGKLKISYKIAGAAMVGTLALSLTACSGSGATYDFTTARLEEPSQAVTIAIPLELRKATVSDGLLLVDNFLVRSYEIDDSGLCGVQLNVNYTEGALARAEEVAKANKKADDDARPTVAAMKAEALKITGSASWDELAQDLTDRARETAETAYDRFIAENQEPTPTSSWSYKFEEEKRLANLAKSLDDYLVDNEYASVEALAIEMYRGDWIRLPELSSTEKQDAVLNFKHLGDVNGDDATLQDHLDASEKAMQAVVDALPAKRPLDEYMSDAIALFGYSGTSDKKFSAKDPEPGIYEIEANDEFLIVTSCALSAYDDDRAVSFQFPLISKKGETSGLGTVAVTVMKDGQLSAFGSINDFTQDSNGTWIKQQTRP